MGEQFLIEKRGLYYRPESAGYTGLKCEAGRYDLDAVAMHFPNMDSPNQDGMRFYREDEAPEFSPSCAWDVRVVQEAISKERKRCADVANRICQQNGLWAAGSAIQAAILNGGEG